MGKKGYAALTAAGGALFAAGFLAGSVWNRQEPGGITAENHTGKSIAAGQAGEDVVLHPIEEDGVLQENGGDAGVRESDDSLEEGYVKADDIRVRIEDGQVQWYDGRIWHSVSSAEELKKEDKFYLAEEQFRAFDEQLSQEKAAKRQEEAAALSEEVSAGVKETPKPAARPSVPQAPAATPAPETQPETPPADNGGGNSGGQPPASAPAAPPSSPAAPPPAAPENPPADTGGSDTGDGEDMSWSDDYL